MKLMTFLIFGTWAVLATSAVAQSSDVVSAAPWVQLILPYLEMISWTLIGIAVPIVTALFSRKTGIDVEDSRRDALQTSLQNAAALLIQRAGARASTLQIRVGNPILTEAINYVRLAAPDAIAHFKLKPDDIAEKILAKLPQVQPAKVEVVETPAPVAPQAPSGNVMRSPAWVGAVAVALLALAACSGPADSPDVNVITDYTGLSVDDQRCIALGVAIREDIKADIATLSRALREEGLRCIMNSDGTAEAVVAVEVPTAG